VKAIVCFNGESNDGHPLLWMLKPGFKHVWCCVLDDETGEWVLVDNRRGVPEIKTICTQDFDLVRYYEEHGATVIETTQRQEPLLGPFVAANCVGSVKMALCIRTWALTPYQLYRHLMRRKTHAHSLLARIWRFAVPTRATSTHR
jgi:hypothetical protein